MNKERIAVVIYGGIGVGIGLEGVACLVNVCEKIAKDYNLTVFSLVKVNKNYQPNGYQLISVPFENKKNIVFRLIYIIYKILQQHIKERYSIIHAFGAYPAGLLPLCLGKILGIKTIITFMGGEVANIPSANYGLYMSRVKRKLIRLIAKKANIIIALTQHHAEKLKSNLLFKKLEIIPFGVDLTIYTIEKKKLNPPFEFLYLGNINKIKNIPVLIRTHYEICQQIDAHLTIVGLDTLNGEIQDMVTQLGIDDKVTFREYQLQNQLHVFLEKAHILLHTSLWESQAVVVNEALASGVVVCGTQVGIIDDLDGLITTAVTLEGIDSLPQKVISVLNDPVRYEQLRENGLIWSRMHDLEAQYQKYNKLYQCIIEL